MLIRDEFTLLFEICLENNVGLTLHWQDLCCAGIYLSAQAYLGAGSSVVCVPHLAHAPDRACSGESDRCWHTQPAWVSPSCRARQPETGLIYRLGASHVPHQERMALARRRAGILLKGKGREALQENVFLQP